MVNNTEASGNKLALLLLGLAVLVVVGFLIINAIVSAAHQREEDRRIDDIVNDKLSYCFDTGDC